ncbi:hypothetical protein BD289DRAFT_72618 [Coniella lustricola]|uniref:Uncharacterized protein n=1 Tax=Coniella lustricola TaxID=2025994 RepID=A0A2T2ZZS3_9PEZI|nr:hypothetical protein BD289DRAFT_72618 [Coniella lustricola]
MNGSQGAAVAKALSRCLSHPRTNPSAGQRGPARARPSRSEQRRAWIPKWHGSCAAMHGLSWRRGLCLLRQEGFAERAERRGRRGGGGRRRRQNRTEQNRVGQQKGGGGGGGGGGGRCAFWQKAEAAVAADLDLVSLAAGGGPATERCSDLQVAGLGGGGSVGCVQPLCGSAGLDCAVLCVPG